MKAEGKSVLQPMAPIHRIIHPWVRYIQLPALASKFIHFKGKKCY